MKTSHFASLLLPLICGLSLETNAWPTALVLRSKSNILLSILEFVDDTLFPNVDAYEVDKLPDMCQVWMQTYAGGRCLARVYCDDGLQEFRDWQVCEVGKQQFWFDKRIGKFSIEYTGAGGINSERDGLHSPVLRFKNIHNWEPIVVEDGARDLELTDDEVHDHPYLCFYDFHKRSQFEDGRDLTWGCGIPRLGRGFDGVENELPIDDRGYATGICQIHFVQHQKPDPVKDEYSMEVWIKDANQEDIGSVYPAAPMPDRKLSVTSELPYTVEFRTGGEDHSPVEIAYGAESFNTDNDRRCSVGEYDGGSRQIDCDFRCEE